MTGSDEEPDPLLGSVVGGKYQIDRVIGRGGMGAVYQATNTSIGKRVALKFLDRDASRDTDAVTRFQREAEAASAVESAHIVQIFDSGSDEGRPYLVMELLRGEDLRARIRREGRLELAEAIHIAAQTLRALARAHTAGIVHRDLKPDNVFLADRDDDPMFVKIVDFGISKVSRQAATVDTLTRRGTVLGTAFYMSPEQAQAFSDIDGRADLWSLGAILYESLAGRPPHTGTAYEAVLVKICTVDADDIRKHAPDVPEAIAKVIAKAIARDRSERFQTAEEFHDALALAVPGLVATDPLSNRKRLASISGDDLERSSSASTPRITTDEGAAVRPRHKDTSRARAVVAALVAALGAFALTAFLMARSSAPADDARAAGRSPSPEPPAATPTPAPTAAHATPKVQPVSPAPDAGATEPAKKSAKPSSRVVTRPHRVAPTPAKTGASKPTQPKVQKKGVVGGLELNTSGP